MGIPAKRFTFLDNETNIPVSNFLTASSSDILNSPQFDIRVITNELTALADAGRIKEVGGILDRLGGASAFGASRLTKDFYSSSTLLDGVPQNRLTDAVFRYFPSDSTLRNMFAQVGEKCKASILAGLGNCKNKHHMAKFKGLKLKTNNRTCNLNAFVNLINKIAGGAYNIALTDQCALVRMLAGVAIRGFELGLPNVFSSISGQISDQFLLAQAGNTVMGSVARSGNMEAVIDVANSSIGPMIPALSPSISSTIMSNYQIPAEVRDGEISGFQGRFSGAMNNMEPNWKSMNFISDTAAGPLQSTIPDISNMDCRNPAWVKSQECSVFDDGDALPDIDGTIPEPSDNDYILSGLKLDDSDTNASLQDNFDYLYQIGNDNTSGETNFSDW